MIKNYNYMIQGYIHKWLVFILLHLTCPHFWTTVSPLATIYERIVLQRRKIIRIYKILLKTCFTTQGYKDILLINGCSKRHLNKTTRPFYLIKSSLTRHPRLKGNIYHASDLLYCASFISVSRLFHVFTI